MTHAGYFEGIGGFSLGASWADIETVYTCENNDFRSSWLQQFLPNATHEKDIRTAKGYPADIFTGGFPCQDISKANPKGKGLAGKRSGLWFDWLTIIERYRPPYVVLENSPNLIHRGLRTILENLAAIGYNAEWQVISKRPFGYYDQRKRLILVAYRNKVRRYQSKQVFTKIAFSECTQALGKRLEIFNQLSRTHTVELRHELISRLLRSDAGLPEELAIQHIESYGDAICPHVALLIFELIKLHA